MGKWIRWQARAGMILLGLVAGIGIPAIGVTGAAPTQTSAGGIFVEGTELSVTHRHRWSKGRARIRLYSDEFLFEEEGNPDHNFSVHPDSIRQMNTARAESIWQQFVYTIHFNEKTNAGKKISFMVGEFGVGALREYVSRFAPDAEVRD